MLPEALAYSTWVHRYRLRRYQKTERYLGRLRNLSRHSRYVVKVVRNPFERAVSSFVHAYHTDYEDEAMAEVLGSGRGAAQPLLVSRVRPAIWTATTCAAATPITACRPRRWSGTCCSG